MHVDIYAQLKREDIGTERLALWGGRWNECVWEIPKGSHGSSFDIIALRFPR